MVLCSLLTLLALAGLGSSAADHAEALSKCPGYRAANIKATANGLSADLHIAGPRCNAYGKDLDDLRLQVDVETPSRIHVKIYDAAEHVYQVPESVFPRPGNAHPSNVSKEAALRFNYTEDPFSFQITRTESSEVLFDSSAAGLVFEDQYLRMRTHLPTNANIYGFGEHSDSFRLGTEGHTITIWNADVPSLPLNANLYGSHPNYVEHRVTGSHGVFLLNSNGMDIILDKDKTRHYLEYNIIGGVFDFYFMAGPTPVDVAKQYAEIAGLPVTVPYSGLGFHNCRWGYQDVFDVAEVVHNYSKAEIPLETMWIDIDYMEGRAIFSLDPERFPLDKMRELVAHLHANKQKFVLMVDPAVAAKNYPPYQRGVEKDIFLLNSTDQTFHGVVWPGLAAFPDWFSPDAQDYWTSEFIKFFSPEKGVDIDFLWIDMNEPSNFCEFPCLDPVAAAEGYPPPAPPVRAPPRALPGWPCAFQPAGTNCKRLESEHRLSVPEEAGFVHNAQLPPVNAQTAGTGATSLSKWYGLSGRKLISPPYSIKNTWGPLPQKSINTSLTHKNGLTLYDTHNLYGTMMSAASRQAMLARRPTKRPLVITRSTFAGAGSHVSHWLGDNDSTWFHYLLSIRGMMQFNAIFQISMVGSDVCGFNGGVTEELCARWAMLGAFQPFYRNHNAENEKAQEFYRWKSVTKAARKAIDIRYRLLDYFYTAMMQQSRDGTPAINPVFYLYPQDNKTFGLEQQFFWGPSVLVAPVTRPGATSVDVYLPKDLFYDFYTHERIIGQGRSIKKTGQTITDIPLFLRGGVIVPLRVKSAMTTADLREQDFELLVPVGKNGTAKGRLYLDDGESLHPNATSEIEFEYRHMNRKLVARGTFGYRTTVKLAKVTLLGVPSASTKNGTSVTIVNQPLTESFTINL